MQYEKKWFPNQSSWLPSIHECKENLNSKRSWLPSIYECKENNNSLPEKKTLKDNMWKMWNIELQSLFCRKTIKRTYRLLLELSILRAFGHWMLAIQTVFSEKNLVKNTIRKLFSIKAQNRTSLQVCRLSIIQTFE